MQFLKIEVINIFGLFEVNLDDQLENFYCRSRCFDDFTFDITWKGKPPLK